MAFTAQIIDVFAGPGGLGEGFSAYQNAQGDFPFRIKISVEMEEFAHKTLRLRAFVRHFTQQKLAIPQIYIDYVSGHNQLLGKLLEFREVIEVVGETITENDTDDWSLLSPEKYCLKEFKLTQELYPDELQEIMLAVKASISEAKRMTLGPDEEKIHKVINTRIDAGIPKILIGGPPCQAFSTAGRSRRKGHVINNIVEDTQGKATWDQDNDGRTWLYKEYIKIINEFQPEVFVMENVRGMLSAKITDTDGKKVHVWKRIFSDLNKPGQVIGDKINNLEYDIYSLATDSVFKGSTKSLDLINSKDFVLHAKHYGIPQARERVILLGIKKSISQSMKDQFISHLSKLSENEYTHVHDAIGDLPTLRSGVGKMEHIDTFVKGTTKKTAVKRKEESSFWESTLKNKLNDVVLRLENSDDKHQKKVWKIFNGAFINHSLLYNKPQKHDFLTNKPFETTNQSMVKFGELPFTRLFSRKKTRKINKAVSELKSWYSSNIESPWVLNHETRKHMDTDLCRYMYSASYSLINPEKDERFSPRLPELEEAGLDPKGHKNKKSFIDRFRTQIWNRPATTVTSHISKDGHYYIHPDPSQMRSLTVREAARIQTFPDNYYFDGPRTAQFIQVGNAVPPLLANKIANVVNSIFQSS